MYKCGKYLLKVKRRKTYYKWKYQYKVYYSSTNVERGWIIVDCFREIRNEAQLKDLQLWLDDYLGNAARPVIRDIKLIRKYRVG